MTLTSVLFAGGSSSRMGSNKALLEISGQPLWSRQLGLLRQLQPDALWISARSQPCWCPRDIEVVIDQPPSCGPLSGIAATLARLRTSHLLALAIDLPQMTEGLLAKLRASARAGCGVVPCFNGRFEPLCAVYSGEASEFASAALARGEFSLQRFVGTLREKNLIQVFPLQSSEQECFLNLNSPADLEKFRRASSPSDAG